MILNPNYNNEPTEIVGNARFSDDSYGYREEVKSVCESYKGRGIDLIKSLDDIVCDTVKRNELNAAVTESITSSPITTSQNAGLINTNPFYTNYAERAQQLLDNSMLQVARESAMLGYAPIVAYTPFFLKRAWIDNIFNTVMMTEVPKSPIINIPIERDWLVLQDGTRYQLPDCLYDSKISAILDDASTGINIVEDPIEIDKFAKGLFIVTNMYFPGMNAETAELTQNLHIFQVTMKDEDATGDEPKSYTVPCNINVEYTTHNFYHGDVSYRVKDPDTGAVKRVISDKIIGEIDFENGTVFIKTKTGAITHVCLRGKLANRWNERSIYIDRTNSPINKVMPESGNRINTPLTIEESADALALQNIDLIARNADIMGKTLGALHDAAQKKFLFNSAEVQRSNDLGTYGYDTMTVDGSFDAMPYEQYTSNITQWMTDCQEYFERVIGELKKKLKCEDVVITAVCHPNLVRFMRNDIKWVFEENTTISGVKLQYRYGVYTSAGDHIQIVTTLKMDEDEGIQFVILPLVTDIITFKSYIYSMIIDRNYRDKKYSMVPNLMATHRTLEFEVTPVQGNMKIEGRGLHSPQTLKRQVTSTGSGTTPTTPGGSSGTGTETGGGTP